MLHTIATFAGRVLFARRLHDGHRLALCEIDEADLSELGRQARREALYEIRELERQARRKARP